LIDLGLGSALSGFLLKISSLLDIFDLSFFISGTFCFAGILFWLSLSGIKILENFGGFLEFFFVIIACYGLGLLCFITGRWLRRKFIEKYVLKCKISNLGRELDILLKIHNLNEKSFLKLYSPLSDNISARALYQRLWVEVRQSNEFLPSLNLLNRWWSMAATFGGIAFSLIVWILIINATVELNFGAIDSLLFKYCILILGLIALSLLSFREAARLERNQIEELIASISYKYQ
jgi:hypothetical protein